MLYNILLAILVFAAIIPVGGYYIYKKYPEDTESMEDGIKFIIGLFLSVFIKAGHFLAGIFLCLMKMLFRSAYQEMTGQDLPDYIVDTSLMLKDHEVLELVDCFENHPYDTPVLSSYDPNCNGVLWVDISACGLAERYKHLDNHGIAEICYNLIQTFYMKTRGIRVFPCIRVASPKRLYFAIPLSAEGQRFLNRQETAAQMPQMPQPQPEPLTEYVQEQAPNKEEEIV